jgi:GT2 family glycosyltransferase
MLGGFDISFPFAAGEDREFCEHWLQHGNRLLYAPEVLVYHTHGLTFSTFWQQQFTYGRGAFHFRQIRARRHQGRIRVEPLAFYLHLLRYPLSQVQGWQALLLVGLLLLSQGAITAGFLWERMFCRSSTTGYAPGSTGASSVARGAGGFSRR